MITTMEDAFRVELPASILRAQARISKLILERGLPTRLIRLSAYLVSITSLSRGGRVHLSRAKVATLFGVSERTIDRHLDEMEATGMLCRLVRSRTPGGYFFGTCVKWGEFIWDQVFTQPGRTRSQAISDKTLDRLNKVDAVENTKNRGDIAGSTTAQKSETGNHATILSHYSLPTKKVLDKRLVFVKNQQAEPTVLSSSSRKPFRPPAALHGWIQRLKLDASQVGLLMTIAKRTDVNKTRTRLQDLLNYVGDRLVAGAVLADQASKYLYKCLTSGEDYSASRFVNSAGEMNHEAREIEAAALLRKYLPEGKSTTVAGATLVRQDNVVYRVMDGDGNAVRPLNREQMAVFARKAGLC